MKKIIVILSAIMLSVLLLFSVMAFRDDNPKNKKTECTTASKCEKNKDVAASQKSENSACCENKGDKTAGTCVKDGENTAENK